MFLMSMISHLVFSVILLTVLFQPQEAIQTKEAVQPQQSVQTKESAQSQQSAQVIVQSQITTVNEAPPQMSMVDVAPRLIAHAGGEIHGIRLTNSLQAINSSYNKGFRYFELDMNWTRDHVPVLVHDWGNLNWFINIKHSTEPQTFNDFKQSAAILDLQLMDLDSLESWCSVHKDAMIISDIKSENIGLLIRIKGYYPNIYSALIPQIYSFEEYDPVKELGYRDIMLSLYRLDAPEEGILRFCSSHSLFGVSIYDGGVKYDFLQDLQGIGIKPFIHTVNEYNQYVKFRENGAYGVFTDFLEPGGWME